MHPTLPALLAALVVLPAVAGPPRPVSPVPVIVPVVVPAPTVDADDRGRAARARGHDGVEIGCAAAVDDAFADLDAALYALADEIDDQSGRARRQLRDELAAVVAAAEAARDRACRAAAGRPPPPPPPVMVMAPTTEAALLEALRAESFDEGRVRVLDTALRGDLCVTPTQARGFLAALSFGRGRLDALERLAPHLVDDGTTFTLLSTLSFESEKRTAQRLLQSTSTSPSCRWR
jgi:hypothetical protein